MTNDVSRADLIVLIPLVLGLLWKVLSRLRSLLEEYEILLMLWGRFCIIGVILKFRCTGSNNNSIGWSSPYFHGAEIIYYSIMIKWKIQLFFKASHFLSSYFAFLQANISQRLVLFSACLFVCLYLSYQGVTLGRTPLQDILRGI